MLSFHKNEKKQSIPIAHAYKNEDCEGKPAFTIWYIRDYTGPPQISSSDPKSLLENDRFRLMQEFALSLAEYNQLVDRVSKDEPVIETSSRTMKKAYLEIQKIMTNKLKKCLEFNNEDIWLKPIYDTTPNRKNQILTCFGSSGSGKSWQINDSLCRNPAIQSGIVPMVYIFSSVDEDPSFDGLRRIYGDRFVYKDPRDLEPSDLNVKHYEKKSVLIFDDVNSISDSMIRKMVLQFRNNCLEVARHRSLVIINSEHLFHNRNQTAKLRNSSKYMVFFPRNSPKAIDHVFEHNMNMNRFERVDLIKKIVREGRAQFVSMDNPTYIVNTKRCQLF